MIHLRIRIQNTAFPRRVDERKLHSSTHVSCVLCVFVYLLIHLLFVCGGPMFFCCCCFFDDTSGRASCYFSHILRLTFIIYLVFNTWMMKHCECVLIIIVVVVVLFIIIVNILCVKKAFF